MPCITVRTGIIVFGQTGATDRVNLLREEEFVWKKDR